MTEYTINGKEASESELRDHLREQSAKAFLRDREYKSGFCFQGVPITKFNAGELRKIAEFIHQEWLDSTKF